MALLVNARPLDIRSPNLDSVRGGPSPSAIQVPVAGDKLLSRGCAVTSSVAEPCCGELSFVTDGEKECDENESNMVKIAQGVQWVQIDLGTSQVINAVCIWRTLLLSENRKAEVLLILLCFGAMVGIWLLCRIWKNRH